MRLSEFHAPARENSPRAWRVSPRARCHSREHRVGARRGARRVARVAVGGHCVPNASARDVGQGRGDQLGPDRAEAREEGLVRGEDDAVRQPRLRGRGEQEPPDVEAQRAPKAAVQRDAGRDDHAQRHHHALRWIDKAGGLDNYVLNTPPQKLCPPRGWRWRERIRGENAGGTAGSCGSTRGNARAVTANATREPSRRSAHSAYDVRRERTRFVPSALRELPCETFVCRLTAPNIVRPRSSRRDALAPPPARAP